VIVIWLDNSTINLINYLADFIIVISLQTVSMAEWLVAVPRVLREIWSLHSGPIRVHIERSLDLNLFFSKQDIGVCMGIQVCMLYKLMWFFKAEGIETLLISTESTFLSQRRRIADGLNLKVAVTLRRFSQRMSTF